MYSILSIFPNLMRGWAKDYARAYGWLLIFMAAVWWWVRDAGNAPAKTDRAG
jgi:hypothetical protein